MKVEQPDVLLKRHIAQHLKSIRSERALSLDAVAKLTGVSKAMLGQIEREESSPTIAKLWQIASGLQTSFSAFIELTDKVIEPKQDAFHDDPNMEMVTLQAYDPEVKVEIFDIRLHNFHQQQSQAHTDNVFETIWVLEGNLALYIDGKWTVIEQGESIRFKADQPHLYKAETESVRFQNIVHYR